MMCNGADGGILAAAHLATEQFVEIANLITSNDHVAARTIWSSFQGFIPRLFQEANPMPIKYCLWRQGLIRSPECRLPLSSISEGLARELDHWIEKATSA
jgi:4-hydroxy-tetrahydrodipicolinate synthase